MIQNTDLMDAMLKIATELKTSDKINEFIRDQFYAEELTVYVGEMLHNQMPTVENTPYIVIFDCKKREGINIEFARYDCSLAVGVGRGTRPTFVETDDGIKFLDSYDVLNKFTQLIIDVINERDDGNRPLAITEIISAGVPIDSDGRHWGALLNLQWRIYQTMGSYQEEF